MKVRNTNTGPRPTAYALEFKKSISVIFEVTALGISRFMLTLYGGMDSTKADNLQHFHLNKGTIFQI
jgi:hypothetical protein